MTPAEAKSALTKTVDDTADHLGDLGWETDGDPVDTGCGTASGVKWAYFSRAPLSDSDRDADAQTVADYGKSLGIEVRIVSGDAPAVYGTGGPIQSVSFLAGPNSYGLSGSSMCAAEEE